MTQCAKLGCACEPAGREPFHEEGLARCSVEEPSARSQLLCGCCPPPPPGCCRLTAVLCDLAVQGFFGFLGAVFKPSGRPREQWRATAGLLRSHGLWGCEFRNVDENRGAGEP